VCESTFGSLGQALLVRVVVVFSVLGFDVPELPDVLAGCLTATHFPLFSSWFRPQVKGQTRPVDFLS